MESGERRKGGCGNECDVRAGVSTGGPARCGPAAAGRGAAVRALRPADRVQTRESDEAAAERLLDTYGSAILRLAWSYLHDQGDGTGFLLTLAASAG